MGTPAIAHVCVCLLLLVSLVGSGQASALHSHAQHLQNRRSLLKTSSSRHLQGQQGISSIKKQAQSSGPCPLLAAVKNEPQLKVLADLLSSTGIGPELCCDGSKQVTFLAPNNAAIGAYLAQKRMTLDKLTKRKTLVRSALKYHLTTDPRVKALLAGSPSSGPQSLMLQTTASSAPSEIKLESVGGSVTVTDARGHTAKVLQQITPAGAASPTLLVIDRVLSRVAPKTPSMSSVYTVEESGATRLNGKASLAHADGAVGVGKGEMSAMLQRQP